MSTCSCGEPLRDSLVVRAGDLLLKSCPECSHLRGHHVFFREDAFGFRDMGDGRVLIQSWCSDCRQGHRSIRRPEYECT